MAPISRRYGLVPFSRLEYYTGMDRPPRWLLAVGAVAAVLLVWLFLRMYTRHVTLIAPDGDHALSEEEQARIASLGIETISGPCSPLRMEGDSIIVSVPHGKLSFDAVYPALGSVIRSELAIRLGADATPDGCVVVDSHQRTSIAGLYAAGDVSKGLDQISHAMGEAGVAATTIRNDLARSYALVR